MAEASDRVRQARRHARMTQPQLAERVGVHRSAVAQWERSTGPNPTTKNLARIALATGVSFEWLCTGRGRSVYLSDILAGEETPAVLLEHSAQSEAEARILLALRRMQYNSMLAVVELAEKLAGVREPRRRATR